MTAAGGELTSGPDPAPRSSWALLPALCVSLSAVCWFWIESDPLGYAALGLGLIAAAVVDRAKGTRVLPDLALIGTSLAVISLISLKADISYPAILTFGIVLTSAVVIPYLGSRFLLKDHAIRFPWKGWRWNRAQWTYLIVVVVAGYVLLPYYFIASGVYRNWPAIHAPDELVRLFVGVNAVGIWDELFFICCVYTLLRRHFPTWQANALQAMIFVSFLWELGYQAWGPALTIPFALVQGAIFQFTKNLAYVVTVHLTFDLVVFLVLVHAHNPAWPHPFVLLG